MFKWSEQKITGYVYFIQFAEEGPIKIGYAKSVDIRLRDLQVACPYEIEVLHAAPGNEFCEKALHYAFDDCRIRGEWFYPLRKIHRVISRLRAFETKYPDYWVICRNIINSEEVRSLYDVYGYVPIDLQFGEKDEHAVLMESLFEKITSSKNADK